MNKLKFVFSAIVFSAGLVITTLAQAETIKIGVSFLECYQMLVINTES